tara:strand:+ start:5850 stop:6662 length:813 start_codon:yes stop_codon:yes gene_type:complete
MKILLNISDLNKAISKVGNLGFVPTMGMLHNGHISLIKNSKKKCKKTLVSIFVNPKQFNKTNDYKNYPRNLKRDLNILKNLKVDFVFLPKRNEIFKKRLKKIILNNNDKILCAKYRKGHFEGVLDVMGQFFRIIKAKYTFMGIKDYQQIYLIKKYLSKKYKRKIILCPTIRDKNKVALSSRNFLLNKKDLKKVSFISKNLFIFKSILKKNIKLKNHLINNKIKELKNKFNIKIEYLELRNEKNLSHIIKNKNFRLFIAYYLKKVRLIDNY